MSKLRIANYYENRLGRNDGNPLYMWNAFKQIPEVESGHMVPYGDLTKFGSWDLNFEADWGEDALQGVLPYTPVEIPKPSAFWHSDTHLGYDWRLGKARRTDFNFVAQKNDVEAFKRDGILNPIWMPHAVEPMAYPKQVCLKKYDVCFIGHINSENRIAALDRLFAEFPNFFYGQRLFEDAAEKYGESKIIFNISIKGDLNMRTFEGMATGSFMLTSCNDEVATVFEDGKHLVLYKDLDDMVEKVKYYLAHDDEREAIAKAGYEEVISKHTFRHRAEQILQATGLWERLREGELQRV
jgi:hypothetical protein